MPEKQATTAPEPEPEPAAGHTKERQGRSRAGMQPATMRADQPQTMQHSARKCQQSGD